MYHKHHIIPRHMEGSDDPSNLVLLTVEQHAKAHLYLYFIYGKKEDCIAWMALTGQMRKCSAKIEAQKSWRENNPERHKQIASMGGLISGPKSKGRTWWTDGEKFTAKHKCPGEGWTKCAAPNNVYQYVVNTKWWNNGKKHKRSVDCPGDGWFEGRINKGNLGGDRRSQKYKVSK